MNLSAVLRAEHLFLSHILKLYDKSFKTRDSCEKQSNYLSFSSDSILFTLHLETLKTSLKVMRQGVYKYYLTNTIFTQCTIFIQ